MAKWDYPKYREPPTRYLHHEVVLVDAEQCDEGFPPKTNAREFIKWLRNLIESVPVQYQASVGIEIDSTSGYEGSHYGHVKVFYCRPETDAELAARQADYEQVRQEQEQHERAMFDALKRKFATQ